MTTLTGSPPTTRTTVPIKHTSVMSEKDLFALARVDEKARDVLVRKYLGLVRIIAWRYWGLPREDLFQEGCVGLLLAIDRFDPDLGYRFSAYASWWIRKVMARALQRHSHPIYLPAHVYLDKVRLQRESATFRAKNGREPSEDEIAEALGWCRSRTSRIRHLPSTCITAEGPYDLHTAEDVAEEFLAKDRRARVRDALNMLPAFQREVIEKWYGFECDPMTLREIAAERGVSRETVRRAQKRGEERLKTLLEESLIGREAL